MERGLTVGGHYTQSWPNSLSISRAYKRTYMSDLRFVTVAIILPALIIFISGCIRLVKSAPQSTATDLFGAMIVFDGTVVAEAERFPSFGRC